MKCIKLNVLLVFLILIMSVGMVSATENVSMDHEVNNGNQNLAIDSDVDLISESGSSATFTDLKTDLGNAHDGIVDLSRDYKYDQASDGNLNAGIQVSQLTINGNGHKIDAQGLSRIFNIRSGPVILNNITFIHLNVVDFICLGILSFLFHNNLYTF